MKADKADYISILSQRLKWDEVALQYPASVRHDCLRNAIIQVLQEQGIVVTENF